MPYYKYHSIRVCTIALDRIVASEFNACAGNFLGACLFHGSHLGFRSLLGIKVGIDDKKTDDGSAAQVLGLLMLYDLLGESVSFDEFKPLALGKRNLTCLGIAYRSKVSTVL